MSWLNLEFPLTAFAELATEIISGHTGRAHNSWCTKYECPLPYSLQHFRESYLEIKDLSND